MLGVGDGIVIGATRYAMVPCFVTAALLIYLIPRWLEICRPFAMLAVLLFVLSPLSLIYGRQIFLDNIGVPWLLLVFWVVMSPGPHWGTASGPVRFSPSRAVQGDASRRCCRPC